MILFFFSFPSALASSYISTISHQLIGYYLSGTHISPFGTCNNGHLENLYKLKLGCFNSSLVLLQLASLHRRWPLPCSSIHLQPLSPCLDQSQGLYLPQACLLALLCTSCCSLGLTLASFYLLLLCSDNTTQRGLLTLPFLKLSSFPFMLVHHSASFSQQHFHCYSNIYFILKTIVIRM